MKRTSRLISILLILQMLLATAAIGVFATDETPAADVEEEAVLDVSGETVENTEALNKDPIEVTVTAEVTGLQVTVKWWSSEGVYDVAAYRDNVAWGEPIVGTTDTSKVYAVEAGHTYRFEVASGGGLGKKEVTIAPLVPGNVQSFSGNGSVSVYWAESVGATSYDIYRNGVFLVNVPAGTKSYRDRGANLGEDGNTNLYSYQVAAIAGTTRSELSPATFPAGVVRTAHYLVTFKANVKLKSHDSAKASVTFKKNQQVWCHGYSQGSYKFTYNGRPYEAKWFRMKTNAKGQIKKNAYDGLYDTDGDGVYDYVTAENFVNEGQYTSKTPYLIWVSLYSQRLYIFKNVNGVWKVFRSWQCGTGKAKTPTPTGMNKEIWKQVKHHSHHIWWNCFSSYNAIHGSNKNDAKLGKLISHGCVRLTNAQAKSMMTKGHENYVPLKTRVIVF
jgi:hypothetical protein